MTVTKAQAERHAANNERRKLARRRTLARIRPLREQPNRLERILDGKA